MEQRFFYCPKCGGKLAYFRIGERDRLKCRECAFILYENPVVGVAGILLQEGKLLLGRRSRTYKGQWCIPCGYVEWEEAVEQALIREFFEETGLVVAIKGIFGAKSNFHDPQTHTVGIWYLITCQGGELRPGDDLDRVDYFSLNELPPLAFPTDREIIGELRDRMNCNDIRGHI